MSGPLAQAGVKSSKEMTAVLQHLGTRCDPGIRGFMVLVLLRNKKKNCRFLDETLNWRGGAYLWESLTFSILNLICKKKLL